MRTLFLMFFMVLGSSCARTVILDDKDCGHGFFSGENSQCLYWQPGSTLNYSFDAASIHQLGSLSNELHAAFQTWSSRIGDLTIQFQGNVSGYADSSDGLNTIYVVTSGWDRGSQSQAYTRVMASGDRLQEADMFINLEDFQLSLSPQPNKIHARSLFIHEVGHMLGLVHDDHNYNSVMYPSLGYAQYRVQLLSTDLSRIDYAYQLLP